MVKVQTHTFAHRLGIWREALRKQMKAEVERNVQEFANDIAKTVRRKLLAGEAKGPPLKESTLARKDPETRKLVESTAMAYSVNTAGGWQGEKIVIGIGIFDEANRGRPRPNFLPMVHETGTKGGPAPKRKGKRNSKKGGGSAGKGGGARRIPARPVWKPALVETKASSPAYKRLTKGRWLEFKSPFPSK